MNWEDQLRGWTGPASDNEDQKRERTERRLREALAAHPRLSQQPIKVYAKGSYANNTNVRLDSDVDIAIEYTGGIYPSYQQPALAESVGLGDYTGPYSDFDAFKSEVHQALRSAFGEAAVERRNKCIFVEGGSSTLDADVVPCWTQRHYYSDTSWVDGIAFFADKGGGRIDNYPRQHHDNGVAKNNRTSRRYKRIVRALKRLENDMVDKGVIDEVPSYLIECLVYACPDQAFGHQRYLNNVREVLLDTHRATQGPEPSEERARLTEVNQIKFLFTPQQKWSRRQANNFAATAWSYLGLS